MKTNDIEELFEAAKRHNKDMQRQQHLSDLIDQWAAAETATKKKNSRKSIWTALGVAASILLLVTIGIRALLPKTTSNEGTILTAKTDDTATEYISVMEDQPSENLTLPDRARPVATKTATKSILMAENTLNEINEPSDTIMTTSTEALLAENDSHEPEIATSTSEDYRIYERTSTRLVGSNTRQQHNKRPTTRPTTNELDRPLIAYSGTGTNVIYDLAKINLQ